MNQKRNKHNAESVVEGDINLTPARGTWLQNEVSEETKELLEKDAKYFMHQSMSTPCLDVLQNCEGPHMISVSGKKYLDFHGNNVHQIGFSHPKLVARLTEQLQNLTFSTRRYTNETAIQFAEKLTSYTPKGLNRILLTSHRYCYKVGQGHHGQAQSRLVLGLVPRCIFGCHQRWGRSSFSGVHGTIDARCGAHSSPNNLSRHI